MTNHYPSKALSIAALITIITLFLANSSNPPNGRTGAPGDNGTCISCHGDLNPQGFTGFVDILNFPSNIEPGETYNLTARITNSNGTAVRGGFQAVVLNESDGNTNTGDLSVPAGTNPSTVNSGGREYIEHSPAKFFPASTEVDWDFDWTAPTDADAGDVIKVYTAAVIGNGSGSLNDLVVSASFSGTIATVPDPLMVQITDSDPVNCFDGMDGSATATASDGTSPYEFEWSNGETTPSAVNLTAGSQTVTVTDAMGATATASITIIEPDAISATAMTTPESAVGAMDGAIDLNTTGGTQNYTFLWSNAATTQNIDNLTTGEYCVTITDGNNCSFESCYQVDQIACDLSLTSSVNPNLCENDCNGSIDITIAGGDGNYTFAWSNNETTEDLEELCNGTYSVTVTDGANCQIEGSFTLTGVMQMVNEVTMTDVDCAEACTGSISLTTTGVAPFTYDWSDDQLDGMSVVNDLCAGVYDLTVTDGNGCTELLCFEISDPDPINADVTTFSSCGNECTGFVEYLISGGTAPYTIDLPSDDNLCPGDYQTTVTDANNCILTFSFTIEEFVSPTVTLTDSGDETDNQSNGFFDITVSDGTPPFTFDWLLNGTSVSNLQNPFNLVAGDYTLAVTDDNGCLSTFTNGLTIGSITNTSQQYAHGSLSVYPNPANDVVYVLLENQNSEEVSVSVFDFSGRIVLEQSETEFNNNKLALDISSLTAGVYGFRVRIGEQVFLERLVVGQ